MRQSLRLVFSVVESFESMQTKKNDKWKYKIQQLFKKSAQTLNSRLFSSAMSRIGFLRDAVVAMETAQPI